MKKLLHKLCLGVLIGSMTCNLAGCMMMTDEQKTAVEIYTKKRTPSEMFGLAQGTIDASNYLEMELNYRIEKIDKDKSISDVLVDGESWLLCALKSQGGGYWKGVSTRDNEISRSEEAYVLKKENSDLFDLYKTNDSRDTWVRDEANGVWSGLTITSIDFRTLMDAEGLVIDKEPVKRNDILQWKIYGTITNDEAREFLSGLEYTLKFVIDDRLKAAESVDFEMYMDTENHPLSVYLKFNPGETLNTNYIYTNWEVRMTYQNYDAYESLTIPRNIQLDYITQEDKKEQENSFNVSGGSIVIKSSEAETEESLEVEIEAVEETEKSAE